MGLVVSQILCRTFLCVTFYMALSAWVQDCAVAVVLHYSRNVLNWRWTYSYTQSLRWVSPAGAQIFQKSSRHLKILKCHRTKLVDTSTWHLGFMHPCYHLSIYVQSCGSKRAWGFRDLQAEKCREWLLISLCVGVAWYELFASRQLINDLFPVAQKLIFPQTVDESRKFHVKKM
jgi:hypothetical protein